MPQAPVISWVLNTPAFLALPVLCDAFVSPPHSSTFPHKFSHLRPPSHQPSWELIKLLSLSSTSFPYFCPTFPPTLITSFLSLQFPSLLKLHASPRSWGLDADVIPSHFANNTLCMGTSSHGLCGQPNSPCFQDLRKHNHLLSWVFRNPGVFHIQNSRQVSVMGKILVRSGSTKAIKPVDL